LCVTLYFAAVKAQGTIWEGLEAAGQWKKAARSSNILMTGCWLDDAVMSDAAKVDF